MLNIVEIDDVKIENLIESISAQERSAVNCVLTNLGIASGKKGDESHYHVTIPDELIVAAKSEEEARDHFKSLVPSKYHKNYPTLLLRVRLQLIEATAGILHSDHDIQTFCGGLHIAMERIFGQNYVSKMRVRYGHTVYNWLRGLRSPRGTEVNRNKLSQIAMDAGLQAEILTKHLPVQRKLLKRTSGRGNASNEEYGITKYGYARPFITESMLSKYNTERVRVKKGKAQLLSTPLNAEFADYYFYKTARQSVLRLKDLKRNSRQSWKDPINDRGNLAGRANACSYALSKYYGFLLSAGIPVEELRLYMIADPELLNDYWNFTTRRNNGNEANSVIEAMFHIASTLVTVAGREAEEGYLRQKPALVPVNIPMKWIEEAYENLCQMKTDWLAAKAKLPKDPKLDPLMRIEPILRLDNPMQYLYDMLDNMIQRRKSYATGTGQRLILEYDIALLALHIQRPFRCATTARLTVDNLILDPVSGKLRFNTPANYLKNERYLPQNILLSGITTEFSEPYNTIIREWLEVWRPKVHGAQKGSHALFPIRLEHREGDALKQPLTNTIRNHLFKLTQIYAPQGVFLDQDAAQWQGEYGHWIRKVQAVAIIKATGRYDLAAAQLLDSEKMVRRAYHRFNPHDHDQQISNLITPSTQQ
ncbi:hypothetical protein MTBPR1_30032 [Candidatus Terasakiella magnetica]|uniref:Uncharacterized protein n=1 Tax=Candidatus Terasakiella magnetica TaxID=1867952 RepID=A0A1C3RHH5_9PROT|nr:hypothetical protein [Candidatus Terasakiella magnetica]SCA56662.1 hypothetical protein MTBPR1_30032 [Candidatus Terasakiella magnetica]